MHQKLTTPGQLSWLSKLMAFDFEITYKKGVENVVADALSRVHSSEVFCMAITSVSTDLYPLIMDTWNSDPYLKAMVEELKQDPHSNSKFSWIGDQLRRKDRLVVGDDQALRLRIIQLFHDSSTNMTTVLILGSCSLFLYLMKLGNRSVWILLKVSHYLMGNQLFWWWSIVSLNTLTL